MTEEATQTVVDETKAAAPPQTEATDARNETPDLDSLLKEFEKAEPKPAPETKPAASAPVDDDLRREVAALKFKMEFDPTLARIRGDLSKDVISDEELTDLIDGRAKRDPRLQTAWLNRASNPKAWEQVEKTLSADLAKKFQPRIDKNATEDREAVAAAVRGASSTKAPEEKAPNYGAMTDAEFRAEKAKLGF